MREDERRDAMSLTTTLRMLIAETLLGWAMSVVPKDHPDGALLIRCVRDYLAKAQANQ